MVLVPFQDCFGEVQDFGNSILDGLAALNYQRGDVPFSGCDPDDLQVSFPETIELLFGFMRLARPAAAGDARAGRVG